MPYKNDDLEALHRIWTDPDVRRYLLDDDIVTRDWSAAEIRRSIASFERRGFGQWTIRRGKYRRVIGFCGFRDFHDPPECQLLYGLAPKHWGRGYTTEAVKAVIRHGFESLGFTEIVASADSANGASLRVMEKAGMRLQQRFERGSQPIATYTIYRDAFLGEAPLAAPSVGATPPSRAWRR